jgi:hypothetical protein
MRSERTLTGGETDSNDDGWLVCAVISCTEIFRDVGVVW